MRQLKLIELKQNPRANEQRVRATLKTFKKHYHHEEALGAAAGCRDMHGNLIGRAANFNLADRIKLLLEENTRHRSTLKEKIYELDALTSKYRKIQSMVQSGQYLQALGGSGGGGGGGGGLSPTPGITASASQGLLAQAASAAVQPGGPATATATATSTTNILSAAGSTTLLLTSRSPTRERVSFTNGKSFAPKQQLRGGPNSSQQQQQHQRASEEEQQQASVAKAVAGGEGKQLNEQQQLGLKSGLRSSPLMSSTTFVTTTTSSTNNTTEITTDLTTATTTTCNTQHSGSTTATCSSRLMSGSNGLSGGGSGSGAAAAASGSFSATAPAHSSSACATQELGERVQAISKQVAAARWQLDEAQRVGKQASEQLGLFTIFSYINSNRRTQAAAADDCDERRRCGAWLEGPFCTLMLRDKNLAAGSQQQPQRKQQQRQLSDAQRHVGDSRARPSNFFALRKQASLMQSTGGEQQARKSNVQQTEAKAQIKPTTTTTSGGGPPTKALLARCVREPLPRSLSMIEYLGLSEFDLLARRHERIQRYSKAAAAGGQRRRRPSQQHVRSSCCLLQQLTDNSATLNTSTMDDDDEDEDDSCSCCCEAARAAAAPSGGGSENRLLGVRARRLRNQLAGASSSSLAGRRRLQAAQSDGNLALELLASSGSSDSAQSECADSLVGGAVGAHLHQHGHTAHHHHHHHHHLLLHQQQTSLSCSTCCSLESSSQFYDGDQDELDEEEEEEEEFDSRQPSDELLYRARRRSSRTPPTNSDEEEASASSTPTRNSAQLPRSWHRVLPSDAPQRRAPATTRSSTGRISWRHRNSPPGRLPAASAEARCGKLS